MLCEIRDNLYVLLALRSGAGNNVDIRVNQMQGFIVRELQARLVRQDCCSYLPERG